MVDGIRDQQTVTKEGRIIRAGIKGVMSQEMPNIVTRNGLTTEVFRPEWIPGFEIRHLIHVCLNPGSIAAWFRHQKQTDNVFVTRGSMRLVLFDDREGSETRGQVSEYLLSRHRPTLVSIPPDIWHGIQCMGSESSEFINFFDRPYDHENPDHWRLPADSEEIPYKFPRQ